MLSLVARTTAEPRRTVLILEWCPGALLVLYEDGTLREHAPDELLVDRLEAVTRIDMNEKANRDLFAETAAQ